MWRRAEKWSSVWGERKYLLKKVHETNKTSIEREKTNNERQKHDERKSKVKRISYELVSDIVCLFVCMEYKAQLLYVYNH